MPPRAHPRRARLAPSGENEVGSRVEETSDRIGVVPARPSIRALSTGVPDMTVDSARKATPRSRANATSCTPRRATGHLLEVTTGIPRPAPRACGQSGLAVGGRARRHLDENLSFGGPEPFDRTRPRTRADRSAIDFPPRPARGGRDIEAVLVIDESVPGIGEAHDRDADAIPPAAPPASQGHGRAIDPPCQSRQARYALASPRGRYVSHPVKRDGSAHRRTGPTRCESARVRVDLPGRRVESVRAPPSRSEPPRPSAQS